MMTRCGEGDSHFFMKIVKDCVSTIISRLKAPPSLSGVLLGIIASLFFLSPGFAQEVAKTGPVEYRTFFGIDPRTTIWVIAQIHLLFGAFVLGVPIFAVLVEYIGYKTGEQRYDRLSKDFTKLLSAAYATTAALGGLMAFSLYSLYPRFMAFMTDVFSESFYIYAFLFFLETFTLYFYYYSWDRLKERKLLHIFFGVLLNVWGISIVFISNSWAAYMMSPVGIDKETGQFIGTTWQAITNPLSIPLLLHRLLGNVLFGGLVAGLYAAIKFIGAKTEDERAHYDWMGYIGNFVAISTLIFLPFAGYYLGREIYSTSAIMGNNMMGGAFSWTFIIQAILVGLMFVLANYYLWLGMGRIPGSERYERYIKYINALILIAFAVWLTPHNLPLSGEEQASIGGQFHPTLKWIGLMPAKNAVINLIILSTFFSYLIYRRGNKGNIIPISEQGGIPKVVLTVIGLISISFLTYYAIYIITLDPNTLDLPVDRGALFRPVGYLLLFQAFFVLIAVGLAFVNKGKLGQGLLLVFTLLNAVVILGVYGFFIMAKANPFLRNVAVAQWLSLLSCLVTTTFIDIFLFRGAETIGQLRWGRMPTISQYVLIALAVVATTNMALMGYIRAGLRENWHIYSVLEDTSDWAFTPSNFYAAGVMSFAVIVFLAMIALLFWFVEIGERGSKVITTESATEKTSTVKGGS